MRKVIVCSLVLASISFFLAPLVFDNVDRVTWNEVTSHGSVTVGTP